jgi:2,4-dienoyl-CoA reductase-like NADH-dependent reductase (Old Yellow Enzyme family)
VFADKKTSAFTNLLNLPKRNGIQGSISPQYLSNQYPLNPQKHLILRDSKGAQPLWRGVGQSPTYQQEHNQEHNKNSAMNDKLFTPIKIGPCEIRNRTIRSAAFENMCVDNEPSEALFNYHTAVAKGGIGMTTVAYASINQSGLSFKGQLWMREQAVPKLKELTDAIHAEGAKASIQVGHCGNMTHRATCGQTPVGATGGFNLYSPTFVRGLKVEEIDQFVKDFENAIDLVKTSGFDCVEIHAGHGYLISQFLSPYTNHRKDEYGGSLENRMKFMIRVISAVRAKCTEHGLGLIVKVNMNDGFKAGMQYDECLQVMKKLEELGVDALVLTAGFVSRAPMEVMRGCMPYTTLAYYMDMKDFWWLKLGIKMAGRIVIPEVPYKDLYFLEEAKKFRAELKLPLIYVGGIVSRKGIDEVLDAGFEAVQIARALVHDTDFVNKLKAGDENTVSGCKHSNYCIGRMYSSDMKCHCKCDDELPPKIKREIEKLEKKWNP